MVEFNVTNYESKIIGKIIKRANGALDMRMDLEAVHSNGCPLDFAKLLEFPEFDFQHDVSGIHMHIDRKTGKLVNHFCPRCSKPEVKL